MSIRCDPISPHVVITGQDESCFKHHFFLKHCWVWRNIYISSQEYYQIKMEIFMENLLFFILYDYFMLVTYRSIEILHQDQ